MSGFSQASLTHQWVGLGSGQDHKDLYMSSTQSEHDAPIAIHVHLYVDPPKIE